MRRVCVVWVLGFAAACAAVKSVPRPDEIKVPPVRFEMQDYTLPSGLRVLVQRDPSTPTVVVVNVVGAGDAADPDGKEGVAHLVEHLTYRARPAGQSSLWDLLERVGAAAFNAETRSDVTTYWSTATREALPDLLRLEGARIANPLVDVDEATLTTEREIVRNELREQVETGISGSILSWLRAAVFPPGHPYARPPSGTHESLSRIALADAQKFVRLHYRPDNMTLMIVGDVDLARMSRLLTECLPERAIGDPQNPIQPPARRLAGDAPEPPASPPHGPYRYQAPVSTPEVWIGWSLPGAYRPDSVLQLFVEALTRAALPDAIRHDRDIVSVNLERLPGTRATLLACRIKLREGKHPEESAQRVLDELYQTAILPPSLLGRMTRAAANAFAVEAEDQIDRAQSGAVFTHFTGNAHYFARSTEAILTMQVDPVVDFAKHYLRRERARVLVITPSGARPFASAAGLHARGSASTPASVLAAAASMPGRDAIAQVARVPGLGAASQGRLGNGLDVVVLRRSSLPVATIGLALLGGLAGGRPPGVAELGEGAGEPESLPHGSGLEYGAQSGTEAALDQISHIMQGFGAAAEPMLAILSDEVRSMRAPYEVIEDFKKYHLDVLAKEEQSPDARAERAFWKALYGDHPYGQRPSVTTFAQLGQSDANEWIARNYRPANGVLAVVGDIDPQEVQALAQKWFGDWKQDADGSEVPPPPAPSLVPHEPRVVVTHRPGATQGEIRFGCLLPAAAESTEATYDLLAALVVKHLFRTLRQELGVTYGVDGVALELRGGAAHLTVQTAIENAALPTALRLFREHLRALEAGRIDDQELASARWDLARRFNLRFATNRSFAEAILERRTKGWTLASLDRYPARLAEVAASELRSAFATCRITEVLSVIGDEPTVRAALREGWTAGQ